MLQPNSKNNKILFFCDSLHTLDSTISQNTSLDLIKGYRENLLELGYNSYLAVFSTTTTATVGLHYFLSVERPE